MSKAPSSPNSRNTPHLGGKRHELRPHEQLAKPVGGEACNERTGSAPMKRFEVYGHQVTDVEASQLPELAASREYGVCFLVNHIDMLWQWLGTSCVEVDGTTAQDVGDLQPLLHAIMPTTTSRRTGGSPNVETFLRATCTKNPCETFPTLRSACTDWWTEPTLTAFICW